MSENEKNELETQETPNESIAHAVDTTVEQSRLADLREKNKKLKKRMLLIFGCVVLGIALLLGIVFLIEYIQSKQEYEEPEFHYSFYPPYEGDIMQNPDYLALDRKIFYCADPSGYGAYLEVSEDTFSNIDSRVAFLYLYLQNVIAGEEAVYNELFNENYYRNHQPHEAFNPQMLYEIKIVYQGGEGDDNGDRLELYTLSYKIYRNDGSFRRDIGSDMSRDQLITLRVSKEMGITVENLITLYQQ